MRNFLVVTSLVASLALLAAVGFAPTASAAVSAQSDASWNLAGTSLDGPGHPGRPGRPGPGGPRPTGEPGEPRPTHVPGEPRPTREPGEPGSGPMCMDVAKAVHTACPCNGPDGNGWASHEAFVQCVTDAANAAVAGGAAQECADKAIERAQSSKVGTEGFQCKPAGRPGGPGHPGRPGGPRGEHPTPEPTAVP